MKTAKGKLFYVIAHASIYKIIYWNDKVKHHLGLAGRYQLLVD